jgi:PA domain
VRAAPYGLQPPIHSSERHVVQRAVPSDACEPILNGDAQDSILLAHRGNCTFFEKAVHAASVGAAGLIIINNSSGCIYLEEPTDEERKKLGTLGLSRMFVASTDPDDISALFNATNRFPGVDEQLVNRTQPHAVPTASFVLIKYPKLDPAALLLLAMAVATICVAAVWTGKEFSAQLAIEQPRASQHQSSSWTALASLEGGACPHQPQSSISSMDVYIDRSQCSSCQIEQLVVEHPFDMDCMELLCQRSSSNAALMLCGLAGEDVAVVTIPAVFGFVLFTCVMMFVLFFVLNRYIFYMFIALFAYGSAGSAAMCMHALVATYRPGWLRVIVGMRWGAQRYRVADIVCWTIAIGATVIWLIFRCVSRQFLQPLQPQQPHRPPLALAIGQHLRSAGEAIEWRSCSHSVAV